MSISFLLLMLAPPALGVALGRLSGGRLRGLRTIRIRALWLVWLAAGAQLVQYRTGGMPMLVLVFGLVLAWLAVNLAAWPRALRVAGALIVLGASLNGLAIALNGRMPYRPSAHPGTATTKNVPADAGTRVAFLGDTIDFPLFHADISVGDILIGGGACAFVVLAMRRRVAEPLPEEVNHDPVLEPRRPDRLHPGDPGLAAVHDRRTARARRLSPLTHGGTR